MEGKPPSIAPGTSSDSASSSHQESSPGRPERQLGSRATTRAGARSMSSPTEQLQPRQRFRQEDAVASRGMEEPTTMPMSDYSPWNAEEHELFMNGLEMVGARQEATGGNTDEAWLHIAAFMNTRTPEQVREHGRAYLAHLVQHTPQRSHQGSLEARRHEAASAMDMLSTPSRYASSVQSDASVMNRMPSVAFATPKTAKANKGTNVKPTTPSSVASPATSFSGFGRTNARPRAATTSAAMLPSQRVTRTISRPKSWSFAEDKAMETRLAAWAAGEPCSWESIASGLPDKSAHDVHMRYEQLVEDIASIERGALHPPTYEEKRSVVDASPSSSHQTRPPPIQVSPMNTLDTVKSMPRPSPFSNASSMSDDATTAMLDASAAALSPTFLEFLAREESSTLAASAAACTANSSTTTVSTRSEQIVSSVATSFSRSQSRQHDATRPE